MNASVRVKCPVCGHVNPLWLTDLGLGFNAPRLVACDTEEGGCDSYFSYQPVVTVAVKVVALAEQFNEQFNEVTA